MKNLILLCFSLGVLSNVTAQNVSISGSDSIVYRDSTRFYEHAYWGLTYTNNEQFVNLNSITQKYFPNSISQKLIGLVYGGKSVFGPGVFQGEVGLAFASSGRRNEGRTSLLQGYLSFDGGLMLTQPGALRIYPFAGLGVDVTAVMFRQSPQTIHFDSLIANPAIREGMEPISFNAVFLTWRAGLAIDIGKRSATKDAFMSIRAGYRQSFNSPRWNFEGNSAFIGNPADQLKQWFGGIVFYSPAQKMKERSGRK